MKQDVILSNHSDTKMRFYSGISALVIYFLVLVLLLGGFHFYKENMRYGELDTGDSMLLDDGIEIDSVESNSKNLEKEATKISQEIQENTQNTPQDQLKQTKETMKEPTKIDPILAQTQSKDSTKEQPKEQKEIKSNTEESPKEKEIDLADVFSNVSSKTMQEKRLQEEAARQEEIKLRKKQQEEAQKQQAMQLAQNAEAIKQTTQALQASAKNLQENVRNAVATKVNLEKPKYVGNSQDRAKYDEWYAKIEQILMREWRKTSKFYEASTSAKVRIRIDSNGRLSYVHMIKQSPYGEYNNSVIQFIRKMEKRAFPPPPGDGFGDSIDTNLELENALTHE